LQGEADEFWETPMGFGERVKELGVTAIFIRVKARGFGVAPIA
jgi:hypothetical protein